MTVEWHEHEDLKVEFGRYGCGHHEHDGMPTHYHYVSGDRIDWRDDEGEDHSLRRQPPAVASDATL